MKLALEIIAVAMAAIRANALRSFLTTLGIIIGVAAVITMVALGEGAQQSVEEQIQRMGTNVLTIRPGQSMWGGVRGGSTERLTLDDAEALRRDSGGLLSVAPEISSRTQITYLRWNSSNTAVGTWPDYFDIYDHELILGRYFNQGEVQGRRRVVILGYNVPEELSTPPELLIGKTIQMSGQPFEVIGVLAEKGGAAWMQPDDQVFVPVTTAMYRLFGGRDRLSSIYAATPTPEQLDLAYGEIDRILRREHRIRPGEEPDFSTRNSADLLSTFNETNQTFTYLLAGIAAVSLLVGGIGIMNIMLVSVTERTREIGVRKALGATRKAILFQFLIEALVLCFLGGLLGVTGGWGAARLMQSVMEWDTVVAPEAVITALVFSAGIGLFFGIWPAQRAAKMDPIDALRYE
ncbi:MAG: ABC transporter permease [Gemmatimonadetes bacterium]|nr:ABC transporter permease [Gemmatimonadota bacterium]MBT8403930.1 ABC transporter permease [Gemmatimonadota bacterium]NNF39693.1 FtsX-like permease family protein [Gemmatimonadota bacterium]NNK62306.1 FtsX-like permease family protein [Gemmatimonadota bacterium]